MRRQEIIEGSQQIIDALRETGVREALQSTINVGGSTRPKGDAPKVLRNYKAYLLKAVSYSTAARHVIKAFGLETLEDPEIWVATHSREQMSALRSVNFAVNYLPELISLLQQESAKKSALKSAETRGETTLTLILPEETGQYSTTWRVANALLAIETLFEVLATLANEHPRTLSVIACDSGSDKSFDLLGAAKIVDSLKELLLSVWNRVVFFRELKVAQRMELVANALPILEKISELEAGKSIGPEEAEILRRKVIQGVGQFLSCGAVIPEMVASSNFNPLQLMAPEPKLLTTGLEPPQAEETAPQSRKRRTRPPEKE